MIPQELRSLDRWVVARPDKVPVDAKTGALASVVDAKTWASFEVASAFAASKGWGVGFVVGEPYVFIDVDNKPGKEAPDGLIDRILGAFDSYTEVSQSGRGYHIVVKGAIERSARRGNIEVYKDGRYIWMTGNVWNERTDIRDGGSMLLQLVSEMGGGEEIVVADGAQVDDDWYIMQRCHETLVDRWEALWRGEWQALGYESQSEADYAMMREICWHTPSNEQAMRVFRMSGLGQREKAQRNDKYLGYTLRRARSLVVPIVPPMEMPREAAEQEAEAVGSVTLPPGLVGDIARYTLATYTRPVPEVALLNALGIVAGVVGRSFHVSQAGLNLYLVLLGKTGVGKEAGKFAANILLKKARETVPMIEQFQGPGSFASGQALLKHLVENPCFFSFLDEVGLLLRNMIGSKASTADIALHRAFLSAYSASGPNGRLGANVYSKKENSAEGVDSPSFTIIGESTPERFYEVLDQAVVEDGLVSRLVVLEYHGERPDRNRGAGVAPAPELVQRFADLAVVCLSAEEKQLMTEVNLDGAAVQVFDAFDAACDEHIRNGVSQARQIWNRAHLNALKVAAVVAVGVNPYAPMIDENCAKWAVDFVSGCIRNLITRFTQGEVGGGDMAKGETVIRRVIEKYLKADAAGKKKMGASGDLINAKYGIIPHQVIYQNVKTIQPFKTGGVRMLEEQIRSMVTGGILIELSREQAANEFKSRAKVYVLGESW